LIEELDEQYEDYWTKPEKDRARIAASIFRLTQTRPDFLEGLLAKADTLNHPHRSPPSAGRILVGAVKQAEQLMPKGFKGEVPWGHLDNRFYHRLLYSSMEWNIVYGAVSTAITLARKQLRLNPNDNLGVRYFLPVLLAARGFMPSALKALPRLGNSSPADAQAPYVRSLVYAAVGWHREAARELLHALFAFPALRQVVASSDPLVSVDPGSQRGIILDLETLELQRLALSRHQPSVFDETFSAWINHPLVLEAEATLEKVYQDRVSYYDNQASPPLAADPWTERILTTAQRLSEVLVVE
jgi:hypothetical protein